MRKSQTALIIYLKSSTQEASHVQLLIFARVQKDIMRQVEVAGSYYELGLNYGRIVAENKLNWWWKQPTESALALVKECEREIAVHAPGLLDEIRGIADA